MEKGGADIKEILFCNFYHSFFFAMGNYYLWWEFKSVKADATIGVNIWMINWSYKSHIWRIKGVSDEKIYLRNENL